MIAIKVYAVFLNSTNAPKKGKSAARTHEIVEAIIAAYERCETGERVDEQAKTRSTTP